VEPEQKRDVAADITAIHALPEQYTAAVNSSDAVAVAATYADDGIEMPPNLAATEGKQAIQAR
jgi:ketosteroid isomerase-like protein